MKAWPSIRRGVGAGAGFLLAATAAQGGDFKDHLGMQLWSVRGLMMAHPEAAMAAVHDYGITEVETAATLNRAPAIAAAMRANHLVAISAHEPYDAMDDNLPAVIAEARVLGVAEIDCSALSPRVLPLDEAGAHRLAQRFNAWGRTLHAAGFRFGLHVHGQEFRPLGNGTTDTTFDVLMRETDPQLVSFELDVFWAREGGADPVALLKKYPGRWSALHLKDMRVGAPLGRFGVQCPPTDRVAVGSGVFDWPMLLRTAESAGVKHYYLEEESADPAVNIPRSLAYLRGLKL